LEEFKVSGLGGLFGWDVSFMRPVEAPASTVSVAAAAAATAAVVVNEVAHLPPGGVRSPTITVGDGDGASAPRPAAAAAAANRGWPALKVCCVREVRFNMSVKGGRRYHIMQPSLSAAVQWL
jgi:hypothetical protein